MPSHWLALEKNLVSLASDNPICPLNYWTICLSFPVTRHALKLAHNSTSVRLKFELENFSLSSCPLQASSYSRPDEYRSHLTTTMTMMMLRTITVTVVDVVVAVAVAACVFVVIIASTSAAASARSTAFQVLR